MTPPQSFASVFTNASIAATSRSLDSTKMLFAGSWSVYWYNGLMYSSEIARGLDIFELVPSQYLSENEIAAARQVRH